MVNPVNMNPIIITQKLHHGGVDIRDYDYDTMKILNHRTMERSRILSSGLGKKYGEPFIELEGLETGMFYIYSHNTPLLRTGVEVGEGVEIGKPSLIGTWAEEDKKAIHLHLSIEKRGKKTEKMDPLEFFSEHGIEYRMKNG